MKLLIVSYLIDINKPAEDLFPYLPFKLLKEIKNNYLDDTPLNLKFKRDIRRPFFGKSGMKEKNL